MITYFKYKVSVTLASNRNTHVVHIKSNNKLMNQLFNSKVRNGNSWLFNLIVTLLANTAWQK